MLATKAFQLGSSAKEGPSQTQGQKHPPPSPGRTGFRPTVYFLNFLFGVSLWACKEERGGRPAFCLRPGAGAPLSSTSEAEGHGMEPLL